MFSPRTIFAAAALLSFIGPAVGEHIGASDAAGAQELVIQSAEVVRNLNSNPDFARLLAKAKGVLVVPDLVKGALVLGGSGGKGVLVTRRNENIGTWSNPAFMSIGSISFGAQAGGKAGAVVIFLMSDKAVAQFAEQTNLSFTGDANLTLVTWSPYAGVHNRPRRRRPMVRNRRLIRRTERQRHRDPRRYDL